MIPCCRYCCYTYFTKENTKAQGNVLSSQSVTKRKSQYSAAVDSPKVQAAPGIMTGNRCHNHWLFLQSTNTSQAPIIY